jgi:hypothetical protein
MGVGLMGIVTSRFQCLWLFLALGIVAPLPQLRAQMPTAKDPLSAAQAGAARRSAVPNALVEASLLGAGSLKDPIYAAQVLAAAKQTFPNLVADLGNAELFRRAVAEPNLRGNLRGHLAENDWISRNSNAGWRRSMNNDPENDAFRIVNGQTEAAQIKVHADWHDYIRSMKKDGKADRFVVPDDHFGLLWKELETCQAGALRGGQMERAVEYARQQQRLTKMGRTFSELDGAIGVAAKHFGRIATAIRAAGKAASFVGIALAVLDGGIAVYEVAIGKREVDELVARLSKIAIGGGAAWAVASTAGAAVAAAGATGAVPVAVAIVMAAGTYIVVDWTIDSVVDATRVARLGADDIKRIWPAGARGVSLDRLYRKPPDANVLVK